MSHFKQLQLVLQIKSLSLSKLGSLRNNFLFHMITFSLSPFLLCKKPRRLTLNCVVQSCSTFAKLINILRMN